MSVEVQPGRWRQRDGRTATVSSMCITDHWPWKGINADGECDSWQHDGHCLSRHYQCEADLVEYLGPEEPQATS